MFHLEFILFGTLWVSWTWVIISFPISGKFSIKSILKKRRRRGKKKKREKTNKQNKTNKKNKAKRIINKNNKRNEENLRDHCNNAKRPNIRIIGVPEEEDKKKGHEKILEEIIVENFPKMGKEIIIQVQKTQRLPNRINPR